MNLSLSPGSAVTTNPKEELSSAQPPLLPSDTSLKMKSKKLGGATPAFTPSRKAMVSFAAVEE